MSKPAVKVFTKENPCNKLIIWNTFRTRRGFKRVEVAVAESQVGHNAPKNMLNNGYVERVTVKNVEYFELTEEGREWLKKGIAGYVKRHPEDATDAVYLPKALAA